MGSGLIMVPGKWLQCQHSHWQLPRADLKVAVITKGVRFAVPHLARPPWPQLRKYGGHQPQLPGRSGQQPLARAWWMRFPVYRCPSSQCHLTPCSNSGRPASVVLHSTVQITWHAVESPRAPPPYVHTCVHTLTGIMGGRIHIAASSPTPCVLRDVEGTGVQSTRGECHKHVVATDQPRLLSCVALPICVGDSPTPGCPIRRERT